MARGGIVGAPLGAAALALALGACGGNSVTGTCPGGGSPPCAASTTPTPCTQSVIVQDNGGVPARTIVYDDISVPDSGRLDVTMDWTNASSQMGFYLVPANTCTIDEFNARSCNFLMRSEASSTKPRKVSQANFIAGNYRWMVGNYSASDESAALQIVLSKGSCPGFGGAPPSRTSRAEEALPPIGRAVHR